VTVLALVRTALAVGITAATGAIATDPDSAWYRSLDKPRWQPPSWAFPAVWTPLYGLLAVTGARVLDRTSGRHRTAFSLGYSANLLLNTGWTVVFFRLRSPTAALAEIVVLNVSNLDLLRRAGAADRLAAGLITPYVAWTVFATALTASIARRNPRRQITADPVGH
jgi:benzodiazapine receptor